MTSLRQQRPCPHIGRWESAAPYLSYTQESKISTLFRLPTGFLREGAPPFPENKEERPIYGQTHPFSLPGPPGRTGLLAGQKGDPPLIGSVAVHHINGRPAVSVGTEDNH